MEGEGKGRNQVGSGDPGAGDRAGCPPPPPRPRAGARGAAPACPARGGPSGPSPARPSGTAVPARRHAPLRKLTARLRNGSLPVWGGGEASPKSWGGGLDTDAEEVLFLFFNSRRRRLMSLSGSSVNRVKAVNQ